MTQDKPTSLAPEKPFGPLAGCRVLELGSTIAAPFVGRFFADFGAEVIKVETPSGDPLRSIGSQQEGKSLWWSSLHRNKRVMVINMKTGEGRDLVKRLAGEVDILVENFRPKSMEKWGLGWDTLSALYPRLIMVRVSGFGQTGPYSDRAGFGIVAEAMSGLRSLMGDPDRPPARVAMPLTDYVTGLYATSAALMALHHRDRIGAGQCVDAALYESAFSFMEGFVPAYDKLGEVPTRTGSAMPGHVPNNLYLTGDGRHIHIAAGNDRTFRDLMRTMGRPELAEDPRFAAAENRSANQSELEEIVESWTTRHAMEDLYRILLEGGVPAAPIYTVADTFADPHFAARDMVVEVPDDTLGSVKVVNVVPKLSATPGEIRWAGRKQGADTRAVLRDLLGMGEDEISALEEKGAIGSADA